MGRDRESHQAIYLQLSSILSKTLQSALEAAPTSDKLFLHVTTESLQVDLYILCFGSNKRKKIMCIFPLMFILKFIWNSIMFVLIWKNLTVQRDFDFAYIK